MQDWTIRETGYSAEDAASLGNRFLVGNGYLGVRGTLEEYEADKFAAINLAGLYDRVGERFREPVSAPNGCFAYLRVDGTVYRLPDREPFSHEMELDYRHGIFRRRTTWNTIRGKVTLKTERFASMKVVNAVCMRFSVSADFHADVELVTGIDGNVWDLNGPHLEQIQMEAVKEHLLMQAVTHEKRKKLAVAESVSARCPAEIKQVKRNGKILHYISFITRPGEPNLVEKCMAVCEEETCDAPAFRALQLVRELKERGYEQALQEHSACWEELWSHAEVMIKGDEKAMRALNYSLYHLLSIAPRHSRNLSIPARGLSGQTYRGAIFWDTEMFMLDFFLMTEPRTARSLMQYRIDTLQGALEKAAQYGFEGAFYAWESQEGGYDACTDYNVTDVFTGRPMRTYFRDKQVHISAAIVYGILRYTAWTGDESLLDEKGVRTVVECARFYYSLLLKRSTKDCYEIHDVIGPDEYHERVNNNGYTNRMARFTLEKAAEVIERAMERGMLPAEYDGERLIAEFRDGAENLYLPAPRSEEPDRGVIEQFDGYFAMEDVSLEEVRARLLHEKEYWGGANGVASHTKIIKQADVVTWLNLFDGDYPKEVMRANWEYYEPRTEHGSSLSAGMYAMLACKIGEADRAYPFFIKSAMADLQGGGKEWEGLLYIGGTHPAAAGAAYMTAVEGFAGVSVKDGRLVCEPHLPKSFEEMKCHVFYRGQEYEVHIQGEKGEIRAL